MNLGKYGENVAVDFLRKNKYVILKRNFRTRRGEIDIICEINKTLVYVEVKTRRCLRYGAPYEAVTPSKIMKIKNCAAEYRSPLSKKRIDCISIIVNTHNIPISIQHFEAVDN